MKLDPCTSCKGVQLYINKDVPWSTKEITDNKKIKNQ